MKFQMFFALLLTVFAIPAFADSSTDECGQSSCGTGDHDVSAMSSTEFKLICEAPYQNIDTNYKQKGSNWVSCGPASKENDSTMKVKCINYYIYHKDVALDWQCKDPENNSSVSPEQEFMAD